MTTTPPILQALMTSAPMGSPPEALMLKGGGQFGNLFGQFLGTTDAGDTEQKRSDEWPMPYIAACSNWIHDNAEMPAVGDGTAKLLEDATSKPHGSDRGGLDTDAVNALEKVRKTGETTILSQPSSLPKHENAIWLAEPPPRRPEHPIGPGWRPEHPLSSERPVSFGPIIPDHAHGMPSRVSTSEIPQPEGKWSSEADLPGKRPSSDLPSMEPSPREIESRPVKAATTPPIESAPPTTNQRTEQPTLTAPQAAFQTEVTESDEPGSRLAELAPIEASTNRTEPAALNRVVESLPTRTVNQIFDAVRSLQPGRPLDITLNPPELGRVRLALQPIEAGMSVVIMVERAETMDLMRRNIETLESMLKEAGYSDVAFQFGGDQAGERNASDAQRESSEHGIPPEPRLERGSEGVPARQALGATGQLDIRI